MPGSEGRDRLAESQAELVRALTNPGQSVHGFDPKCLGASAVSLWRKRARAAARAWPSLFASLGDRARSTFAEFAEQVPLPEEGGPQADGRAFVEFLARKNRLPDSGRLEALFVDLHHARTPRGLSHRHGFAFKAALLRRPRRIVVGVRLPWLGVRWFALPLDGSATSTTRQGTSPGPPAS
jgi:hypothetical protein